VSERNETNNQRTDAIAIGPDLVLSTFTAPTAAGAGSSISVSDTTRNQGAGTAPASTTGFYLSTNAIFDDSDVLLGTRSVPELAAAASSSASTSLILPATTAAGIYYVLARADGESSVAETNEANNMRTASISIGPDLVVSALTAPAAAVAGSTISVTDTSRNQGAGQAAAASTSFYLSTNAVFDAADVPLGLRALPELAPGATSAAPTSLTIPHTASAGIHYIPRPCRRRGSRSRDEREQQRSRGRPSPSALPDAGPRLRGPSPWPPWTGHPATGEHESSMITRPLASLPAAPTVSALDLDDVRRCTELLQAIVDDRALLAEVPLSVRQDLLIAAGRVSRPESHKEKHLVKALRRARRNRDLAQDRKARAATGIRVARDAPVFVPPQPLVGQTPEATPRELKTPKACYVCKAEFTRLHHFYDALCPACAELNYAKRFQTASLLGRVGLVTGARVKIGFHTALKMLRAGARVIATTRFPHDAALRYSGEPDFAEWKDRLHVHGLDLRHSPSVEIFARYLEHSFDRLDILVNNACQTVRRPPGFYAHLLENESRPLSCLPQESRSVLRSHEALRAALERGGSLPAASEAGGTALTTGPGNRGGLGITASSALSQVAYAEGDATTRRDLFPTGRTDADLQQVDLRRLNSWRLALADVPTAEMLEVHLVNAVAPFILCARLKPLMLRQPTRDKHIVNVSAMEGVFSRGTKTDKHPHTNMAKAALNMMTLTASRDYVRGGIHMNAVDTGWVTDEDPALHAERKRNELDFQPPLDIVDGASRVCDPFFSGLLTGDHVFGRFLKDYRESSW
jgi:NAD(P)-dependent dehydrogenase (short-subunit alcohol dehydrogenase family)